MTCNHCVMSVKKQLEKIPYLQVHDVLIGSAVVEYDEARVSPEHISAAIEEAGYTTID